MNTRVTAFALVVACSVGAMGCANTVVITYSQRMNFNAFDPDPVAQPHFVATGGFTAVYIKSIKNPASGKTYQFKPGKLYYNGFGKESGWGVGWNHYVQYFPWHAGDVTVAAGQTVTNLGCVVFKTEVEPINAVYYFNHDSSTDNDSVLMEREGEAQANVFNPGTAYIATFDQHCQP